MCPPSSCLLDYYVKLHSFQSLLRTASHIPKLKRSMADRGSISGLAATVKVTNVGKAINKQEPAK